MKTVAQRSAFAFEFFKRMKANGTNETDAFITACSQAVVEALIEERPQTGTAYNNQPATAIGTDTPETCLVMDSPKGMGILEGGELDDEDDPEGFDCQKMPDGTCQIAGTEECDLCPNSN